ncbi:MAG: DUF4352 domain-containing protein [Ktedonobacteraceae bacterium]
MQQPPSGQGWLPQMQPQQGFGRPQTSYGQAPSPYPPQQGQWNQGPYTPYPPQQGYPPQQPNLQPGHWQQPITPNPQWSQQPYGQPPYQPKKKKSKLLLIIGVSVVLILFACIGASAMASHGSSPNASSTTNSSDSSSNTSSSTSTSSSNTSNATSSTSTSSSSSTTTQVYKVGDTITVDSVGCTLVSAKILAGDEFTQPKPGNEFVVVHVKIHNNNSQQTDYNEFDFHAKSGSGSVTDFEIAPSTYTANNELNSGHLDPGGTVEGDIIFQVPIGDHKAELTWQPNFFGNTTENAWNLGL